MKANGDKCHLFVTTSLTLSRPCHNIDGSNAKNKKEQKLLGIKFNSSLSFQGHTSSLCKKASKKLHVLARIVNYMDLPKRKVSTKAFIRSQFSYCLLIWVLHSRTFNNCINNNHERALRLTHRDNQSSFQVLLEKDYSVTVHHKNLQVLLTEILKLKRFSPWHH